MRINEQTRGAEPIAALDAIRTEWLQDPALSLLHAVRQSDVSWQREWARWHDLELMKPSRIQRGPARGADNVQQQVRELLVDLECLDQRLAHLCAQLPEPGEEFVALAEVRGLLSCVRTDLLADAIETLEKAATRDEAGLRLVFARRQHLRGGA